MATQRLYNSLDPQANVWEPGFNTGHQAPQTLATGSWWGTGSMGAGRISEIEHPTIVASMGGWSGNAGGGRLNPYGGGGNVEAPAPMKYAPTRTMPEGKLYPSIMILPMMGGKEAGTGSAITPPTDKDVPISSSVYINPTKETYDYATSGWTKPKLAEKRPAWFNYQ